MAKIKNKNKINSYMILFITMIFFAFAGYLLVKYSHNANKELTIKYQEKSNIDYKVYLKENSFFETPYLEKNKTYIASLIDYILVEYDYTFIVDSLVSGKYSYYIKGTVSANKTNSNDQYWSKDYNLTEKITKEYNNEKNINIKTSTKIDYQQYNELLKDFKSQYGVTMDGLLKISLVIEDNVKSDLIDRTILKNSEVELNIPLTTLTVEVPIETNELDNNGTLINETYEENHLCYTVIKYLGYICFICSSLIFVLIMYIVIQKSRLENVYNKTLKRILKTYDNIIVNTSSLPDLSELNVIYVTSFDELIDAHGEVRNPINLTIEKNYASFILISEKMAWRYDLIKEKNEDRKKQNENK